MIEILDNNKVATVKEGDPCVLSFMCRSKEYSGPISYMSSCGCSTPDGPRHITENTHFNVTVKFDSKDRKGTNKKSINITTDEGSYKASFTVNVI